MLIGRCSSSLMCENGQIADDDVVKVITGQDVLKLSVH